MTMIEEDKRRVNVILDWAGDLPCITLPKSASPIDVEHVNQWLHAYAAGPSKHVEHHARNGRKRLADTRQAIVHKFTIADFEGYMTIGLYDDGQPGELFIVSSKEGSTTSGLLNWIGVMTSVSLQYGIPLEDLARKMIGTRFEPSGRTKNDDIPMAFSIADYVFRFLIKTFAQADSAAIETDAGINCPDCGSPLIMTEGCMKCYGCGYSRC